MAESSVSEKICDVCGVEIREGSQFCYNCGGAVPEPRETASSPSPGAVPGTKNAAGTNGSSGNATTAGPVERPVHRRPRPKPLSVREVAWEAPERVSWSFIVSAALFALLTICILVLALYFR